MRQHVLLISKKSKQLAALCDVLCDSNIDVSQTEYVNEAKVGLKKFSPTFVLLDFNIKGIDSLLTELTSDRFNPQPYILVASNFNNGSSRAAMFNQGADACIDNPINVEEVLAVINATLRRKRYNALNPHKGIKYIELQIEPASRTVIMREKPVRLTYKEFEVLNVLASHIGFVLTKEEIFNAVWKSIYDPKSTYVSDQISSIRKKLGLSKKDTTYIQTVKGVGYRFGSLVLKYEICRIMSDES